MNPGVSSRYFRTTLESHQNILKRLWSHFGMGVTWKCYTGLPRLERGDSSWMSARIGHRNTRWQRHIRLTSQIRLYHVNSRYIHTQSKPEYLSYCHNVFQKGIKKTTKSTTNYKIHYITRYTRAVHMSLCVERVFLSNYTGIFRFQLQKG